MELQDFLEMRAFCVKYGWVLPHASEAQVREAIRENYRNGMRGWLHDCAGPHDEPDDVQ